MSRIAKNPIIIQDGTNVSIDGNVVTVKGKLGERILNLHKFVNIEQQDNKLIFTINAERKKEERLAWAQAGTARSLVFNAIFGVNNGWEKKLILIGVGYKAQAKGRILNLNLGFSHPINYSLPEGVNVETPTQTEVILKGIDKQIVGQAAADIRFFCPPEPYKGKGVRYENEQVVRKEAKKK